MSKLSLVLGAILLGVGCGSGSTYHCDFRMAENQEDRCQERSNTLPGPSASVVSEAFQATCESAMGDGGDGPCPTTGVVAGCDMGTDAGGESAIDWYYEPTTIAEVEADCTDGTVINP